jgi:hypothetical protein
MRVEHLAPEIFEAQHGNELQNKVYAVYARKDGIKPKPLTTEFPKGQDTVIYIAAINNTGDLLGHMHIESGAQTFVNEVADNAANQMVMVASGFTVKKELSRTIKLEIQDIFWKYAWGLAGILEHKEILVILNDRSESFAKATGYNFIPSELEFNWNSKTLKEFKEDYPGYWVDNPKLWNVRQ